MKYMTHKKIKKILSKGTHTVTFTKLDGSTRVMEATLDKVYLDMLAYHNPVSKEDKNNINTEVVSCIDTEINEWRSFRVDSVTSIEK